MREALGIPWLVQLFRKDGTDLSIDRVDNMRFTAPCAVLEELENGQQRVSWTEQPLGPQEVEHDFKEVCVSKGRPGEMPLSYRQVVDESSGKFVICLEFFE